MAFRMTAAARALLWASAVLTLIAATSSLGGCANSGTSTASDDSQRPRPTYSRLPVR
jgi:hypothetical protein